jgi:peptidyl-prolyl cis-trans isomerase SurA
MFVVVVLGATNIISQIGHAEKAPAPSSPLPSQASSQESFQAEARIAADVNGSIVTEADINARLALLIAASGTQISKDMIPQLRHTILQTLIEELLKIQEAKRISRMIKRANYVSSEDIQRMLMLMVRRSGLSVELFEDFLRVHHISKETLIQQARAQASWSRIINDLFGDSVQISDKEVERARTQFIENKKRGAVLLSRIVIPFDAPEQKETALADIKRIAALLEQGAHFATLAQQFSRTPEAFRGGNLGWVAFENLSDVEREALQNLPVGRASAPILKRSAYVILLCQDKRPEGATTFQEITFQRIFIPAPYAIDSEEKARIFIAQAHEVREHLLTTHDLQKTEALFSGLKIMPKETQAVEEIDPRLRTLLNAIKTEEISQPIITPDGVLLLIVHKRAELPIAAPTKEAVREHLRGVQLEKHSERYLRMLKRTAYIERRR